MIYTHVAAGLLGAVFAFAAGWQVQAWRYDTQIAIMQQAHAESLQAAEQAAREREQVLSQARQKAEEAYVQEKRKAIAAAARARTQLDGLRDELYALPGPAAAGENSAPTCRVDAGALERELLGQCAATLVSVAAEADRMAAQVLGLQGYVRGVCAAPQ